MSHEVWNLLSQALSSGSRSTVLKSLAWLIALMAAGAIGSMSVTGTNWLTVMFGVFLGLSVALYLAAYVYFALKNPDALRSETFSLQKLQIESAYRGDDSQGILPQASSRRLPVKSNARIEASSEDDPE